MFCNTLFYLRYQLLSSIICQVYLLEKYISAVILPSQYLLNKFVFYEDYLFHNISI